MPEGKFNPGLVAEGIGGAIAIGLNILLSPLTARWYRRWGANEAEVQAAMPGDEYVPRPRSDITCAININASTSEVWKWIAQIGCQRAGWYSYDLLDNGGMPSADRIIPEYQQLEIGDVVKAMTQGAFGFPVAAIEPGRRLTLGGTMNTATGQGADPNDPGLKSYFSGDLTFLLKPLDAHRARLVFRMRTGWNPSRLNTFAYRVMLEPISFVMMRKMLLGLRERAERR